MYMYIYIYIMIQFAGYNILYPYMVKRALKGLSGEIRTVCGRRWALPEKETKEVLVM